MTFASNMDLAGTIGAYYYRLHDVANVDATTLATLRASILSGIAGPRGPEIATIFARDEGQLAGLLNPATIRRAMLPALRMAASDIGSTARSSADVMAALRFYMNENSQTVRTRGLSYGSFTYNTQAQAAGKGAVYRVTVDRYNEPLEAIWLEAKTLRCTQDEGQTTLHNETWQFRGTGSEPDFLHLTGSGARVNFSSASAVGAGQGRSNLVANPSFEQVSNVSFSSGIGALTSATDLTSWTISSGSHTDLALDRTASTGYYRGYQGQSNPAGLRFNGNVTITQTPRTTKGARWKIGTPYRRQIAVFRPAGVTGTVTFTVGTQSIAQSLAGLTADAWNVVALPNDNNAYYDNFREAGLGVTIAVTSLSGGNIHVDDVLVVPFVSLDGSWYCVVGGSTAWEREDEITWTDGLAGSDSVYQYLLWRAGLGSLPSATSGSETIAEPTV